MLGNQGCDGPTEKLSSLVDKLLQTIAQQQKSYIENPKVPADVILVSMDVTSPLSLHNYYNNTLNGSQCVRNLAL